MAFVTGVLVVVSVVIITTTRSQLLGQVDARLSSFAPRVPGPERQQLPPRPTANGSEYRPAEATSPERPSDIYEGFVASDGTLRTRFAPNVGNEVAAPPAIDAGDLPAKGVRIFTTEAVGGGFTYRVRAARMGSQTAINAVPLDGVNHTITRLIWVEVLGSLIILAALGLVCWWVIHLGIHPLKRMTQTAAEIAAGSTGVRIPEPAAGSEAAELAVALNTMIGGLNDALDQRAASEDRLRRFIADASHELRTPLTTIRGYAELYRHGGLPAGDALDDAMRRTEAESARMGRLVEDMLTLARLDEHRPLHLSAVDLAAIATDAASDARAAAPERPITLEIADDASNGAAVVEGDEDRLRQVVTNVVANALAHTSIEVPVSIALSRANGAVTLAVHDEGEGMAPEVAARVTERFFRVDPARSRHRGGSGLGLAIVDATIAAHGGTVTIDSEVGRGTTVHLMIPAAAQGAETH